MRRQSSIVLALMLAIGASSCAKARHAAVVADQAFAASVFALDDAEFQACQQGVLSPATCAAANPHVKQALVDVKAVTAAIHASPTTVTVNGELSSLLANLDALEGILTPLAEPIRSQLLDKVRLAIHQAILILSAVTGGR